MISSRKTTLAIAGLLLAAFAVRVAIVIVLQSHVEPYTYEHGEIARNLLEGRGFRVTFLGQDGLTSQQAPLYPALLATAYWLFGVGSNSAHLAILLLQCAAGAATVLCVYSLARTVIPQKKSIAWIAGWGAAVYPPHVYAVTHIQVVVWATLVLAWLASECFSARKTSWSKAVRLGALSGILLLIDPILAIALPPLAFVYWRVQRGQLNGQSEGQLTSALSPRWRKLANSGLARAACMAAVAALVVTPWVMRNHRVHGEFVFIKSTFGYAFWQGNNPHSWGTDKIPKTLQEGSTGTSLAAANQHLAAQRSETLYIDDVLLKPAGYREFAGMTEVERSRTLGDRAAAFIAEDPGAYLRLCLRRLRYFLYLDETNPKALHPLYVASTIAWLALLSAGIGSALMDRRRFHRLAWVTLATFLLLALFHAATISSARFRMPVEPLTFPWCALGVLAMLEFVHGIPRAAVHGWFRISSSPRRRASV